MFRRALVIAVVLCIQLASAGQSSAAGGTIRDGDDAKSPLDIASVSYTNTDRSVTHTVRFFSPVASRALNGSRAVLGFTFETGRPSPTDYVAVVVFAGGALRAAVADKSGHILMVTRARRPNARTIAVTFPTRVFAAEGGYRWDTFTIYKDRRRCRRSCIDLAPNDTLTLFDFTPPAIDLVAPDPFNAFSATADFKLHLKVADKGFSGVRRWTLEERPVGQTGWTTVASRNGGDSELDVPRTGVEGATYEYRVTAVDAKGNESVTTRLVSIPIDDTNPLLANAYLGDGWDAYTNPGYQLFMHTAHRASAPGSVFSYSFTGTYVAWLSGIGCCPSARVYIDDGPPQIVTANNSWRPFERDGLPFGPHTIRIEPNGVPGFEIDGIVTR